MQKFKTGPFGLLLAVLLADIKAKMFSDPLLKNASIDVTTHGQVVTLTGQVPDDSALRLTGSLPARKGYQGKRPDQRAHCSGGAQP